ncbi:MAG: acyl-[acyl-carrier-protein] thioesterase [Lachnospiraceae bacterium]|nr:acyl-[acyl-carrier-protein] thioesterase [Lachnospiraceae bacterium]
MYSYQTRIRYSELDETGHLKMESLLDYFQDCSTFHSEDIGLGVEYLKKSHMVWVMSSWQIVTERYPALGEIVTVGTAPYEFKSFIGYRNFLMTDSEGKRLACANTVWSLINTETGKPVKPTEEMLEKYVLDPPLDMEYAPRKIRVPDGALAGEEVIIKPHHLDTNHHVNNGQYVRIAMDSLEKKHRIRQLRAEYRKQVFLNDVLVPHTLITQPGTYVVVLKDREDNICCIVELQE